MNSNCNIEEIGRIGNCGDNGEKSVNSKEKKRKCKKSSMTNKIESAFDCPQSLQDSQWLWRQKLQNNRRRQSQLAHLTMLLQPSTQKNDSNQNNNLDYSYNHNTNNTNHKHNSKNNNNNNNNNNNENENENENSSESSDINNSKSNNNSDNSDNRYNFEQNGKTTNHPNKPAIACKSVQRGKSTLMNENSIDNSANNNENEIHINCQQLLKFGCPSHDLAPALMHCNYNVPNYLICNGYSVDCCNFDNNINKMCEIKCWNFQQLGVTFRRFLSSENPLTIQILENNSLSMGKCMDIELLRTGEGVFPKKFRPGMYKFDGKSKKSQTKNDKKNKRENKTENKSDNKLGTWFEGKLFYIRKNDKIVLSGLNDNSIKFVFELYCDLTNKKNKDGLNDIIGGIGLCQLNGKNKIYGIRNCLLLRSEESELFNVLQKSKLKVFVDPQKITLLKQKNLKVIVNGINELNLNEMNGKYTSDDNHFNIKQESPSLARNIINENIDLPKLQECDSNNYNICNKDMIPLIPTTLQFCSNNGQLPLTSMHIPSVMNLNSIETEMAYLDYTNMNMSGSGMNMNLSMNMNMNGNGNGNVSFGNFVNDNELNMTSFGELKHIFNGNSLIHPNGNEMIGYPQLFEYSNVNDINNNNNNNNNILGINTDTNSHNNNNNKNNNNNVSECVNMFELNALNQRQTSFNSMPSLSSSSDSMSSNSGSSIGPCCQSNIQCNMPCNAQCNTQCNGMTDSSVVQSIDSSVMSQYYNNNNNNNNNHNGENDEISQFEQFESGFEQCHQFEEFEESFEKEPPLKRRRKLNNCNDNTNNSSNSYNYNCCNNGIVSIADCDNGYFNLFTHNATTN